ncbi:hypothetical protein LOTGIDRAFT_231651 [Lottia gigantea]|uniref:Uncharacterized protein n=1 Tax=Lottia gigantea TaxID=225164 RepID=V4AIJ4_LOTGI|nr:hypothetical protein LOTGIDRAFT_231651 [Lottia gigantea]ESO96812.1 hypothetical protein LOTGIDRAFT_231651 [Lottia gigantea]
MNTDKASNFINSLVRNLQVLCHSNVDFSDNVEVIGHIYLSVDKSKKFNYIVNEKVCKNDDSSTVFVSNSFHAEDQKKKEEKKSACSEQKPRPTPEQSRHHPHNQNQFHTSTKRNSNQSDNHNFSPTIQRQKRPSHLESPHSSHGGDNKKPRNAPSDHPSHDSPNKQIKHEPMSIDLTNVKEEPSENNEISNLSFADISDTSWSHSKHQQISEQHLQGNDDSLPVSFGGDSDNYGIYPVAMYDNNLGSLTSQPTSSQDAIDQQFQGILPVTTLAMRMQMEELMAPRKEITLENKIKIIQASATKHGVKQPQHALAMQFDQNFDLRRLFSNVQRITAQQKEEILAALQSDEKPTQAALAVKYVPSRHTAPKLSTEQREEIIRALQSEFKPSQAALAVKYGVSRQAVNSLKRRYIDNIEYQ